MFDTRKLKGITVGEWRHLTRRRLDETQSFMAKLMGLSRIAYIKWEESSEKFEEFGDTITINEVLYLYRRRAKMTQKELAIEVDCCEYWLREMEIGRQDCSELLKYWEGRTTRTLRAL